MKNIYSHQILYQPPWASGVLRKAAGRSPGRQQIPSDFRRLAQIRFQQPTRKHSDIRNFSEAHRHHKGRHQERS